MLNKEACFLSDYGQDLLFILEQKGLDKDLAFEVLNLLVPEDDLYELEVPRGDF